MLPRANILLSFSIFIAFAVTIPALSQVEPSATGSTEGAPDESEMMTPPPVNGMPYADTSSSNARSNYLATNVTFSPAYIDNVLPGAGYTPVSAVTYSIFPSVALDHSTPSHKVQFTYSPSFTFYEETSTSGSTEASNLDSIDHNASAVFQYRFNPEVAFNVQDNFTRTSNIFNSPYLFSNPISGSALTPTPTVIAPFAEEMVNSVSGVLSYQFAPNAMVGGGGSNTNFDFPNPEEADGLYNSNQSGGQVFYNRRLSRAQYIGLTYQYSRIVAYPATGASETQIHSLLPFYTFYFTQRFSFSISGGIQRIEASETGLPEFTSWSPSGTASFGWQGARGNFAASYSHTVTAGGGLLGVYNSNSVSASGGSVLARTWSGGLSVDCSSINSAIPAAISSIPNGITLTAGGSIQHSFGERFSTNLQYQHVHETYGIDQDINRESVSVTYQLRRPLGR